MNDGKNLDIRREAAYIINEISQHHVLVGRREHIGR